MMIKNAKHIKSFLPGTVVEVKTAAGNIVKKGDVLIIFDAMKMHNRIVAATDGKVKSVNVQQNDTVPKDFLMVELE
ncbi:MAG: biotin/lipoyl-binding protein [Prevotellaceae bacterium]|jgi:biotin carboxyl carrier protein|nr:biotin/lipoyl-binding protein [Prevotellaceae bacterium]